MAYEVTLIPGDGVGPELAEAARMCIEATGVKINWDVQEAGVDIMEKYGTPVPDGVLESCKRTGVALKAPITTPQGGGFKSLNVTTRKVLGLYANVRPCMAYAPFVETKHPGMDVVVVRENAGRQRDRVQFDQYRPYVTMMHTRAVGLSALAKEDHKAAIEAIDEGIEGIRGFLREYEVENEAECMELAFLRDKIRRPNGVVSPWHSPDGKPMEIAAAYPRWPWSDLVDALIPNGRYLDTEVATKGQSLEPFGVPIGSFISGLYLTGTLSGYYCGGGYYCC